MKDFNQIFNTSFELFMNKNFAASLLKISEADMLLAASPVDELISSVENLKGFNYLGLNDTNTARKCFETSLNINPKSSQACAGLGEIFYLNNKDDEAKTMYEWAAVNDGRNQFAVNGLAKVNAMLGLPENDNSLLKEKQKPEMNLNTMVLNANKFYGEKNFREVVNLTTAAQVKLNEEINNLNELLAEVKNLEGFALLNIEDVNSASDSFESALNIKPDSSQACIGLGEVLFKKLKITEAKTMFEWGVKNDPSSLMAQSCLAKVNLQLGYPEYHSGLNV